MANCVYFFTCLVILCFLCKYIFSANFPTKNLKMYVNFHLFDKFQIYKWKFKISQLHNLYILHSLIIHSYSSEAFPSFLLLTYFIHHKLSFWIPHLGNCNFEHHDADCVSCEVQNLFEVASSLDFGISVSSFLPHFHKMTIENIHFSVLWQHENYFRITAFFFTAFWSWYVKK